MSRRASPDARTQRRADVLEAAAGEFARLGFERANINVIAERAGIGKGTIYLYAENKDALFRDVLHEIGIETRSVVDDSLRRSAGEPLVARLRVLADAFARYAREHQDFVRLQASALFGVNRQFQDATAEMLRDVVRRMARVFADETLAGEMRPVAPERLAVVLLGTLQTFALLPEALGVEMERDEPSGSMLADLLWHGLIPAGERNGTGPGARHHTDDAI